MISWKKVDIMKIYFTEYKFILTEWRYILRSYEILFCQHFRKHIQLQNWASIRKSCVNFKIEPRLLLLKSSRWNVSKLKTHVISIFFFNQIKFIFNEIFFSLYHFCHDIKFFSYSIKNLLALNGIHFHYITCFHDIKMCLYSMKINLFSAIFI